MYGQSNNTITGPGIARIVDCAVPSAKQPRDTIVCNITEQLNERLKQLHHHSSRIQSLADRLLGCQPPTPASSGATAGGPTCDMEQLGSVVPFLDYLLDQVASQVSRLEQL